MRRAKSMFFTVGLRLLGGCDFVGKYFIDQHPLLVQSKAKRSRWVYRGEWLLI
jgi:hypothetical protein